MRMLIKGAQLVAVMQVVLPLLAQAGPRIDFNPDNGRSDVLSREAENVAVTPGDSIVWEQPGIRLTIRGERLNAVNSTATPSSGTPVQAAAPPVTLQWGWWKGGYDFGATLTSDGITTNSPGMGLVIELQGLPAGKHSLTTWHNEWEANGLSSPIEAELQSADGVPLARRSVPPSQRVLHDDLASSLTVEFECAANQPIRLRLSPAHPGARVVLNGLAWDIPDPQQTIRVPYPADRDEHVAPNPKLQWQPPARAENLTQAAVTYHLYVSDNPASVAEAIPGSTAHVMSSHEAAWRSSLTDFFPSYYWRVDCEYADGLIVPGNIQQFRIRHDAFVGAEGHGRFAIGGRGGRVIEVTHLGDSGIGSLRAAVEATGPRTIVFRVAGNIRLESKLLIREPYLTIAGQTAPGEGICVQGYTMGCFGTHDVIMRHLRIRIGDESGSTMDGTGFASSDHCIFDHCSISWSIDEAVSSRSAQNITLQRCIVSEALNIANHRKYEAGKGHSFAASISGNIGSFHHNLLAHCAGRNWSLAGGLDRSGKFAGQIDIRNNIVFHWVHRTNDGGVKRLNLVNNLYLPGPESKVFHLLKPDVGSPEDRQHYFVSGNRVAGHSSEHSDNWSDAVVVDPSLVDEIRLTEPFCESLVTTHTVDELPQVVLEDVGANYSGLDALDQRVIAEVKGQALTTRGSRSGLRGIIDSQTDAGGWPNLRTGPPEPDSDHDGLPDSWERAHGLDPQLADQNRRLSPEGVTALEMFLDERATRRKSAVE